MLTLDTDTIKINRVGVMTAKKLKKIGVETVLDLLFYFPFRYEDFSKVTPIEELQAGESVNIVGQIELIQNKRSYKRRMSITEALISDESETIKVIWFNQPFIAKNLRVGDKVSLAGKVEDDFGTFVMKSPVYEKIQNADSRGLNADLYRNVHTQGVVPNYHLTANITQKQVRFLIKQIVGLAGQVKDWMPEEIIKNLKLLSIGEAIKKIHFPKDQKEIDEARRRLAFNELFLIQMQSQLVKLDIQKSKAEKITFLKKETKDFVDSLPFKLTNAQRNSGWEILQDLERDKPMARLLEGDVGSGKTVVACLALLNVALNKKQAVLMVPTEILAMQHFESLKKLFKNTDLNIGLMTRSQARTNTDLTQTNTELNGNIRKSKKKILEMIKDGELDVVIGTHSLIQESISFRNLALAIIDEQHRFGVAQRAALTRTETDFARTDADAEGGLLYEDLTYKIRGAIFNVKKQLGLGHKEKIYQKALEEEFKKIGLSFEKEKIINIKYDNKKIGTYRPDFVVEDKIILETKVLPFIGKYEKQQVWHYLKGSNYQLALLVNFSRDDVKIERFIHTNTNGPCKSVQVRISPHLLSMTATPIPRSLALALYGDLDISIINEMPVGRKKILTQVVPEIKREKAYSFIREQIKEGKQVFVICPLIDISDKLGVKSVKEEFEKLDKKVFHDLEIGMLHGRLKAKEKEGIMSDFLDNKIKILVSTSVVEVGVDVQNATVMMIEGADRFGLAQLHQFRGRVGRGEHQSYCFLFTDSDAPKTVKRLQALVDNHDGFALAKMDLRFRGPGEVYGTMQKGFPELKIASLFDYELMKLAKNEAEVLIKKDAKLNSWTDLKKKIGEKDKKVHLE